MNMPKTFDPSPGVPLMLQPDLALILAPNAGPMTHLGTNTYVLGTSELAVIDPGPDLIDHLDAILGYAGDRPVRHIFVTHSHLDHSPLAPVLAKTNWRKCLCVRQNAGGSQRRDADARRDGPCRWW